MQQQRVVAYQPESQLYCVRAVYTPLNPSDPSQGIDVDNEARNGSVTGPPVATGSGFVPQLLAFPNAEAAASGDPNAASKLLVGPAIIQPIFPTGESPQKAVTTAEHGLQFTVLEPYSQLWNQIHSCGIIFLAVEPYLKLWCHI